MVPPRAPSFEGCGMGREGFKPSTLGLRVASEASKAEASRFFLNWPVSGFHGSVTFGGSGPRIARIAVPSGDARAFFQDAKAGILRNGLQ